MKLAIDHLVIAAPDLESGANHVADLLGVAPQGGGAHPRMGTHNRVMGMFGGMYLEVIAIDPAAPAPERPPLSLRSGPGCRLWSASLPSMWCSRNCTEYDLLNCIGTVPITLSTINRQ